MLSRSLAILLLVVAMPASAQRVEIILAEPLPTAEPAVAEPSKPIAEAMAGGFDAYDSEASFSVPPPGTIFVPPWLRVAHALRVPPAAFMPGCGDTAYRVRPGLALVSQTRRARYYGLMTQAACEAGIPVGLFDALIVQESRYNPAALSPKGAFGLTQLMPGTARGLRVNALDPLENLRGGARYLRQQLDAFGRVDLALAAYNAGPGRVRSRWSVPPYRETIDYVARVTSNWASTALRTVTLTGPAVSTAVEERPALPYRSAQLVVWQ